MTDAEYDGREPMDEDDYDLLTYGEAGTRLEREIIAQQRRIVELEAGDAGAELAASRDRLAALQAAQERNSRKAINDENFERFFGYPARPKA